MISAVSRLDDYLESSETWDGGLVIRNFIRSHEALIIGAFKPLNDRLLVNGAFRDSRTGSVSEK